MEPSVLIAYACFVLAIPQAIVGIVQVISLFGTAKMLSRRVRVGLSFFLIVGTTMALALGGWLFFHPLDPKIVTNQQLEVIPCPITQQITGNGRSTGAYSPVNTGNGNSTNYGVLTQQKPDSRH